MKGYKILISVIFFTLILSISFVKASWTGKIIGWLGKWTASLEDQCDPSKYPQCADERTVVDCVMGPNGYKKVKKTCRSSNVCYKGKCVFSCESDRQCIDSCSGCDFYDNACDKNVFPHKCKTIKIIKDSDICCPSTTYPPTTPPTTTPSTTLPPTTTPPTTSPSDTCESLGYKCCDRCVPGTRHANYDDTCSGEKKCCDDCLTVGECPEGYECVDSEDECISKCKYYEGYKGYKNNCKNEGSWVTGKFGTACKFTKTGEYIKVPKSSSLNLSAEGQHTFDTWIKPEFDIDIDTQLNYFVFDWYISNHSRIRIFRVGNYDKNNNGKLRFLHYGNENSWISYEHNISDWNKDEWHHVAMVWDTDAGWKASFVDGELVNNQTGITVPDGDADYLFIGGNGGIGIFNGTIDEAKVWNRALSEDEIKAIYNENRSSSDNEPDFNTDGLVGYWKMDENEGVSISDSSGKNNDGIFNDVNKEYCCKCISSERLVCNETVRVGENVTCNLNNCEKGIWVITNKEGKP
ncbi:MAG: hypothetical protein DRN27_09140, partial [Thermoplasmata archaeon]